MSMQMLSWLSELRAEIAKLSVRVEKLEENKQIPAIQRPVGRPPKIDVKAHHGEKR